MPSVTCRLMVDPAGAALTKPVLPASAQTRLTWVHVCETSGPSICTTRPLP